MNITDALNEIQSRSKPYLDVGMLQGTFSNTIKAIKFGFAKPKTIDDFMGKFGYIKSIEQWEKK